MRDEAGADEQKVHASRRVAAVLRADIEGGKLRAGARLPSYRALADQYGVAHNTAQAAVRLLQSEGLVTIRPASGAYVIDRTDAPLASTSQQLRDELAEVRDQLKEVRKTLAATEETVSGLLDRLMQD
ncbi:GntR family transcriptional regulator [Sphaerisporangium fuscum]|uniref:GntR family transcriptional regulator n=1 Tax=Sphaerisporangium fuscum TaxID=2835868 RepID=UPI001BDC6FA9|nr:winged helix-turn-helix domain-containing protein [Sphaerisporangium fuscum]